MRHARRQLRLVGDDPVEVGVRHSPARAGAFPSSVLQQVDMHRDVTDDVRRRRRPVGTRAPADAAAAASWSGSPRRAVVKQELVPNAVAIQQLESPFLRNDHRRPTMDCMRPPAR